MRPWPPLLLLFAPAYGAAATPAGGTPRVEFHALGCPTSPDISWSTSNLHVTDDGDTLTFGVALDTLDSGMWSRDQHMKDEYAETSLYTLATLVVERGSVRWPTAVGETTEGSVAGSFTAHGESEPVEVTYRLKKTKTATRVDAGFDFDVGHHGIAIPDYMGVDPTMHGTATFDLVTAP